MDLPNPGENPGLPHCRWILHPQEPSGKTPARLFEWIAMPFSKGSSQPGDGTLPLRNPLMSPTLAGGFFNTSATGEPCLCLAEPNSHRFYQHKSWKSSCSYLGALFCRLEFCCFSGWQIEKDFPGGSDDKESSCNVGGLGLSPVLGRSLGKGSIYPLQYSCLENPMSRGAWRDTVHAVAKSQTWLTN